jgi:scyllo-inositol 2-dehydrogenase (NADP+)
VRLVVVGLGVQGHKRVRFAGESVVATVDPVAPGATYAALEQVPIGDYDAAMLCLPDGAKPDALEHLVRAGKHVLVEKPLIGPGALDLSVLERVALDQGVALYAAYNHRFEPHLARLGELLRDGVIGEPHRISIFYGNGTARDVRASPWRDEGLGVVGDLVPHLLDILEFTTGRPGGPLEVWSASRHENAAPDHFLLGFPGARPVVTLEGSLLSWRNTFRLEVLGTEGSAHVDGLCKWGPSTLTVRERVLPSGKPPERRWTLELADPTWALEHEHFMALCDDPDTDLERDRWVDRVLCEIEAVR